MTERVSRLSIIGSIVRKDLKEYGRDKLWVFLTGMVLIVMAVLFWVLPDSVDESITIGVSGVPAQISLADMAEAQEQGLRLVQFDDADALRSVVASEADAYLTGSGTVIVPDGPVTSAQLPQTAEAA